MILNKIRTLVCLIGLLIYSVYCFGRIDSDSSEWEDEIDVKLNIDDHIRHGRSFGRFPDILSIDIPTNEMTVTLTLRQNHYITSNVPVTVERNGNIIPHRLHDEQEARFYFDADNGASFMVKTGTTTAGSEFKFSGMFNVGNQIYLVQPPDDQHKSHTLSRAPQVSIHHDDHMRRPDKRTGNQSNSKRVLKKRFLENTVYEVELLMVADYSVYTFWKNKANGSTTIEKDINAKKHIREYYALLLNAMDLRYKSVTGKGYTIKLLFAGLHIADTSAGASWTENIKQTAFHPPKVNSSVALKNFKVWENHHDKSLPGHDHAMLFTKYDLESTGKHDNLGKAYLGGLCDEYDVSVIEDTFAATVGTTAAHELGHNLNAEHDGEGNGCHAGDGYVMDAVMEVGNDTTFNRKLWVFSNCTLNYFDSFIKSLNGHHTNCMRTRSASYNANALNEFATELLGQLYTPDDQCEATIGKGSYMCRQTLDSDYRRICGDMDCSALENNGTCVINVPWGGTTCGNGKLCYEGQCVASPIAPKGISDTCVFGDQPGHVAKRGKTCHDMITVDAHHFECYNYHEECCETCANVEKQYVNIADCKYGDKAIWCGNLTTAECYSNNDTCCSYCRRYMTGNQDCMYGDKQDWCTSLTARECYKNDDNCCSKCKQFETGIQGCRYGDKASWCSTLQAHECYANDDNCCSLCKRFHTGIAGCEYGDRNPTCSPSECSGYDHHTRSVVCCKSCAK